MAPPPFVITGHALAMLLAHLYLTFTDDDDWTTHRRYATTLAPNATTPTDGVFYIPWGDEQFVVTVRKQPT